MQYPNAAKCNCGMENCNSEITPMNKNAQSSIHPYINNWTNYERVQYSDGSEKSSSPDSVVHQNTDTYYTTDDSFPTNTQETSYCFATATDHKTNLHNYPSYDGSTRSTSTLLDLESGKVNYNQSSSNWYTIAKNYVSDTIKYESCDDTSNLTSYSSQFDEPTVENSSNQTVFTNNYYPYEYENQQSTNSTSPADYNQNMFSQPFENITEFNSTSPESYSSNLTITAEDNQYYANLSQFENVNSSVINGNNSTVCYQWNTNNQPDFEPYEYTDISHEFSAAYNNINQLTYNSLV